MSSPERLISVGGMLHTAARWLPRQGGVAGMGWFNHERRRQARSSWNIFIYVFHWGKRALTVFFFYLPFFLPSDNVHFLIKQPFHPTLNFLSKQSFWIQGCKKSDKKSFHKAQKLRNPDTLLFLPLPWLGLPWTSFQPAVPTGTRGLLLWHLSGCVWQ